MYDEFLVLRNYGKLSAKIILGTSTVIEKMGLLSYFLFLARAAIIILLKVSMCYNFGEINVSKLSKVAEMFKSPL